MEKGLASHTYDANEKKRDQDLVAKRAVDRVTVAKDRHNAVRVQMEADTERECTSLQQEVENVIANKDACEADTLDHINDKEMSTRDQELQQEQHNKDRANALENVALLRDQREQHTAHIDSAMHSDSGLTQQTINSSKTDTQAKLDALRQQRQEIQAKFHEDNKARKHVSDQVVHGVNAQSAVAVLKSEGYRHRAAKAVDYAGELAQAARTVAQDKVQRNDEKSTKQTTELATSGHKAQAQCDVLVKDKLRHSVAELEAAHDYCMRVKWDLDKEATQYARKMCQLERESEAKLRDVERKVHTLECERMQNFNGDFDNIKNLESQFRAKRDSCEGDLDAIKNRLLEIEAETKARVQQIMADWVASSEAAEDAVKQLEQKGKNGIEEMQAAVDSTLEECTNQKNYIQQTGAETVSALQEQAKKELESTQPTLEEKRRTNEEVAAAAIATFFQLKKEPPAIEAEADAEIAACMARGKDEEERLQNEADAQTSAARAVAKAAQDEEQWLLAETAEAWARLRKACHQLRLMNLHDFSQSIVTGEHDAPLPSILQQ